ncbi:MAG: DNA polymerase I [Rhodothermaeota bacterium MED-G16]|nr:MAG: DNA polymerase I [Rhodothermaeota bacterium MED-G16]
MSVGLETKNKVFLLDAMALIYRAHFAFSKNPIVNSKGINTSAVYGFLNTLLELLNKEKPTHVAVAFDTKSPTFRSDIFSEYKANRERQPEDIQVAIPIIKNFLEHLNIKRVELDGFEADDIIGTLSCVLSEEEDTQVFMMTPDKDFAQLVKENVFLYKPAFMGRGIDILGVNEVLEKFKIKEVDQVIDFLGLQGDSVDNIPGIPGVGPKTAQKLLSEYGSVEGILENKEKIKGSVGMKVRDNTESALMSKELAKIKTDISLNIKINDLKNKKANYSELNKLLDEMEFRTIKNRMISSGILLEQEEGQLDFFSNQSSVETENLKYKLIDKNNLDDLVKSLTLSKSLCVDTETSSLNIQEAELAGIALSNEEKKGYYIPTLNDCDEVIYKLKPLLENPSIMIIGHNLKYDLQILKKYNINIKENVFDTMLAHYLINPESSHKLDVLSENYLNHKCIPIEDIIGKRGVNQKKMTDLDPKDIYVYACEDADITFRLKNIFEKELKKNNLTKLFYDLEIPLMFVLCEIENNGVKIDSDFLSNMSTLLTKKINETQKSIHKIAGEEFNVASPKQLGVILFDKLKIDDNPKKTKSGQYSTSEDILTKLSKKSKIVSLILEYREYKKLLSTYIDALPQMVSSYDKLIHTDYAQAVTATGRLSSNKPNLQNIPIRTQLGRKTRSAFVSRTKGNFILAADYSQIELRIIASFSEDKEMINAFNNNKDIHSITASKVFGISLDDVTQDMRRRAKEVNFGIIYGISPFGLSQNLDIPRGEAKEIIDAYFDEFKNVKLYMDRSIEEAKSKKQVKTLLGRRRFLRDIDSRNYTLRGFAERNAINSPIQGTAADIIKLAMISISKWMKENNIKSKMIMQVHDELVFDVEKTELELLSLNIKKIMENVIKIKVPLLVEVGYGKTWLEAH